MVADAGHESGLPEYGTGSWDSAAGPSKSNDSGPSSEPDQEPPKRDRKADYAISLQKACNTALQRVRSNNVVANSNWASPLAAAPAAISTMAILLKAADKEAAAGLEIESQEVRTEDGNIVMGTLPSKYFHTNLQHCSDVGRLAFLDAQHGMSTIRATARSMIAEEGSIGYIIDLLEDPEDARYNLKPEIEAVKKTAKKCLDTATLVTSKFEYWYLVILHLKLTSLTKKDDIIKEKEVTKVKRSSAVQSKEKYEAEKQSLKLDIQNIQKGLKAAENDVDRAQLEVDRLRYEPIMPEPSALEEIEKVRRMLPDTPPPSKDRGFFVGVRDAFVGQSREHEAEDAEVRKAHYATVRKLQDEALARARDQRNYQRKLAAERLKHARDVEDKTILALNKAYQDLADRNYQLGEAKANLAKAKGELELLSNKDLELASIMTILDNSTKNLGKLKEQIEPLVDFFKSVLGEIDHTVDENLEAFLRPILNGIKEGTNREEVEAINISQRSKSKMIATALQMQGRFSAIADISTAYITVSADYIRPAINKMESLSTMTDSEWQVRSKEFMEWCDGVMTDIDGVTKQTCDNVEKNMARNINALQRRAIEAAAENDGGA